ncbi:hypothetical protein Trydic_g10840 [Trypoxylus dichotomus]
MQNLNGEMGTGSKTKGPFGKLDDKIILKRLRIRLPVSSNQAERTAYRAGEVWIRERINYHRLPKTRITQECEEVRQKIGKIVNDNNLSYT